MRRLSILLVMMAVFFAAAAEAANFVDNGNGTVTDNKTGLMWQQDAPGNMTWDSALSYCEGLPLGTHSDWRLPNIKELESLTDDTRYNPAIDATFFPNASASYSCWSSTTFAGDPGVAWFVGFYGGGVDGYNKDYGVMYVRCVRGGQSGSLDNCTYNLSHPTKQFTSSGGEDTVTVSASSQDCQWTATESLDWVTITSDSSGTGSGSVSYTVSANSSQNQRIGSMTIAGKSFSINQDPLSPIPTGTPKMSVSPRSLNFASMKAGASAQKPLTISNSGTGQLLVNSINISGANAAEFSQTNNCTALASKGACTVTVTFNPTLPFGGKVASLTITSNDAKKGTISVNLSGQASASKISVKPSSLSFGTMVVGGTPVIKTVKVFNKGLSDLIINSVGITGTNASEFSQTNDCGTVQAGGTCSVSVTYTPNSQAGKKSALLVISSNDPKKLNLNVKLTARTIATKQDTTPPSVPTNLDATATSSSQINLSWSASTDNVGVTGYKIYKGGTYLKSVTGTTTSDTGLSPSINYCYKVSVYDAANNESGQSNQVCVTTSASFTYTIFGRVTLNGAGLAGVTVALTGSAPATTDAGGNYTFTGLVNGGYTITPSKTGYTFNPTNSAQMVNGANIPQVNFTAVTTSSGQAFPIGTWNDGPDGVSVTISQLVVNGGAYEANQFFGSVTFLGKTIAINSLTDPLNFIQGRCIYPYCGDERTERTDWYLVGASDLYTSATPVGAIVIELDPGASNTQMTGSVDIIKWSGESYSNGNAIFTLQ